MVRVRRTERRTRGYREGWARWLRLRSGSRARRRTAELRTSTAGRARLVILHADRAFLFALFTEQFFMECPEVHADARATFREHADAALGGVAGTLK
jgi:hypothetical protein